MKKLFLFLSLTLSLYAIGQKKYTITDLPGRPGFKQIIIQVDNKPGQMQISNLNILDANPDFKKPSIPFVPFEMIDSVTRKPKSLDDLVELPATKRGRPVKVTVRQVLEETNAMEKELSKRGHSLRDDEPFKGLNVVLKYNRSAPALISSSGSRYIPTIKKSNKYKATPISQADMNKLNNAKKLLEGMLNNAKPYWAFNNIYQAPMGEFGYFLHELFTPEALLECYPAGDQSIIIAMPYDSTKNLKKYTVDIYNGSGNVSLVQKFIPMASVTKSITENDMQPINKIYYDRSVSSAPPPGNWYFLRINIKDLDLQSKIGTPTKDGKKYYFSIKLVRQGIMTLNNRLGYVESTVGEQLTVNYKCTPPITVDKNTNLDKAAYDFRKTDPSGKFGLYLNTTGFKTKYSSTFTSDNNCNLINSKGAKVEADFSIGAVSYNFENLINSSAPSTEDHPLFSAKFLAVTGNKTGDNGLDETNQATIKVYTPTSGDIIYNFPVAGGNIPLNYIAKADKYTIPLFDQRFFIGPVPCRVTVNMDNEIGAELTGMVDNSSNTIVGTFRPYAKSSITGTGGIDAYLLYANISVGVNLIDLGVTHTFTAAENAKSDRTMDIGAFGGNISFNAGFFYPCGKTFWTGKFCNKNFAIEILKWDGAKESKTF